MDLRIFERLHQEGLIADTSFERIRMAAARRLFSVHWELKVLLYLGVSLLSTGLGILIYKNIDTIGHQAILAFIAAVSAGCFYYCYKHKQPFSWNKVPAAGVLSDYLLLLACLTFVSFIAYLQYQYTVFGPHPRIAGFIPLVVLFFCAYYFDHLGVLSLAITNLAAWMGIVVTPLRLLKENDFNSETIIYIAIALGVLLIVTGELTARWKRKQHFRFTYLNFGVHVLFIALLSAMFHFRQTYTLWFLLLAAFACYCYLDARRQHSFYFILILTIYSYIALGYVVFNLVISAMHGTDEGSLSLLLVYYIGSAFGLIRFLIHQNKKIKENAGI
ncbi:DUF2157 domain-containing protein [Chitinophaga agrisoli]|uniref:DUF2157 domain-containing protein n=1 Tax=Chitinophaga agrisoli TaxID=2607653 RepID=A0A5B2VGI3_9BACT|nr:DUF2157 domain-containing protein [Chitinophaga agrisoli]KAA2238673.1 DUF2157 domain-containing protein [Chitinophaga agrisoli]